MTIKFKPMLAVSCDSFDKVEFPVFAQPKIDGIRCIIHNGRPISRTGKLIPNKFIQDTLTLLFDSGFLPEGADGELTVGDNFNACTSGIMSHGGEPDFTFHWFDTVASNMTFDKRLFKMLKHHKYMLDKVIPKSPMPKYHIYNSFVKIVPTIRLNSPEEVLEFELKVLRKGAEGVILRSRNGNYKYGRSTLNEGYLLKLKKFKDDEAELVGFEPWYQNNNEQGRDELGYAKRSTKKENKEALETLGALVLKCFDTGAQFRVGTGFTQAQRKEIWESDRFGLLGSVVKYKYFEKSPAGVPRHPVFLGFRSKEDM